jgi:hypothetical protein
MWVRSVGGPRHLRCAVTIEREVISMKKISIRWGLMVGLAALPATSSCAVDPEEFCAEWAEDACNAAVTCCAEGLTFREGSCRQARLESCQKTVQIEKVRAGATFDADAALACLGSITTCEDYLAARADHSSEHRKACANVVTGSQPTGAVCESDEDCEQAGDFARCHYGGPGKPRICAKVILNDTTCSYSVKTNEWHQCHDGKYCTNQALPPVSNPAGEPLDFTASCVDHLPEGEVCLSNDGPPCAAGLYCALTNGSPGFDTCTALPTEGEACVYFGDLCGPGLSCAGEFDQTCRPHRPYCS